MFSFETFLYGMLGGLMGMKVFLLGLAAMLLIYTLKERTRLSQMAKARGASRRRHIDVHV